MFAGFIRTLATIVLVWFVFRWLDRMFGGRSRSQNGGGRANGKQNAGGSNAAPRKPQDDKIGDYVDFEELKE